MEQTQPLTCQVVRVTRPNTLLIRTMVAPLQSSCSVYMVLAGVKCSADAAKEIIDWLEINGDYGRYSLHVYDWVRDPFGRLLGQIANRRSGELLTDYLIQRGVALPNPRHLERVMVDLLNSCEPEEL